MFFLILCVFMLIFDFLDYLFINRKCSVLRYFVTACHVAVMSMTQGLDTGLSVITHTARVRFPVKSSGFFKSLPSFGRRCKAVGPNYLLSSGR
jgi:hypothetical protein